jgi:CRP/FNR family cyclic AMP-dependent transcriptional regulator
MQQMRGLWKRRLSERAKLPRPPRARVKESRSAEPISSHPHETTVELIYVKSNSEDTDLIIDVEEKSFSTTNFLATPGPGRTVLRYKKKACLFSQGGTADSVFYLQSGRAKITVVSRRGKEATVTLLAKGDFFGEESVGEEDALRTATATAVTACVALRIARADMIRALHDENKFSDFFMKFLVTRGIRTQADLVDQLFNSAERRLARTLLIMAEYGEPGDPETLIPAVTQETLAEMIGATRSHVSFFMNRFRKLGYIEYNGRIRVHTSLLNVVLHDMLPEENASRPLLLERPHSKALKAKQTKTAHKK